jgi:hypothetical protein
MSGETREFSEVMRPFTTGSDYVNQIGLETDEGSERIKAAYGANYERLVAVKNKYDPTNLFRHNQNIKPTLQRPRVRTVRQIRNDFVFAVCRPARRVAVIATRSARL